MAKNTIKECLSDVRNFSLPQQDRFDRLLGQTQAQLQILKQNQQLLMGLDNNCTGEYNLSYDVASRSEITPCNKICKPLVVYRFTGNVMTSITTLHT